MVKTYITCNNTLLRSNDSICEDQNLNWSFHNLREIFLIIEIARHYKQQTVSSGLNFWKDFNKKMYLYGMYACNWYMHRVASQTLLFVSYAIFLVFHLYKHETRITFDSDDIEYQLFSVMWVAKSQIKTKKLSSLSFS